MEGEMKNKKINKSAFVREQGNIPAKEVVARGKKVGLKFSEKYVHTVRYNAKHAKKSPSGRGPGRPPKSLAVATTFGNAEETIKMLAGLIGIPRAIDILKDERERVRKLIGQ